MSHVDARLDLYWVPLGAGASVVRFSGKAYEALVSLVPRRPRRDLYHSALIAQVDGTRFVVEMAPVTDGNGRDERGVVAEGAVGSRLLGRLRVFRYEVRRWPDGTVPDLRFAVASPVHLSTDAERVVEALALVERVPTPVWGRDELHAGEMWNCNSVVSWVLCRAGLDALAGEPPGGGRAPGWSAGLAVARRDRLDAAPDPGAD